MCDQFCPGEICAKMVRIVKNVHEEIVVHVSNQLRQCGIVGGVQTKLDSTSFLLFWTVINST